MKNYRESKSCMNKLASYQAEKLNNLSATVFEGYAPYTSEGNRLYYVKDTGRSSIYYLEEWDFLVKMKQKRSLRPEARKNDI